MTDLSVAVAGGGLWISLGMTGRLGVFDILGVSDTTLVCTPQFADETGAQVCSEIVRGAVSMVVRQTCKVVERKTLSVDDERSLTCPVLHDSILRPYHLSANCASSLYRSSSLWAVETLERYHICGRWSHRDRIGGTLPYGVSLCCCLK